jgi:hypothetical protein
MPRGASGRNRHVPDNLAVDAPFGRDASAGDKGTRGFARRQFSDLGAFLAADQFNNQLDLPAAALAELGAEGEFPRLGAARRRAGERGLRQRDRPPFEGAAADRAGEGAVGMDDQTGAGLARRRTLVATTVTIAALPWRSRASLRRDQTRITRRLRWWRGWRA